MKEVNSNAETLKKNSLELMELKHVLMTTQLFFDEVGASNPSACVTSYDTLLLLNWHTFSVCLCAIAELENLLADQTLSALKV